MLALEMAIPLWNLLLPTRFPLLRDWNQFLQVRHSLVSTEFMDSRMVIAHRSCFHDSLFRTILKEQSQRIPGIYFSNLQI